jgi:hypothetical protein
MTIDLFGLRPIGHGSILSPPPVPTRFGCLPPKHRYRRRWTNGDVALARDLFRRCGWDTLDLAAYFGVHESEIVRALDIARKVKTPA